MVCQITQLGRLDAQILERLGSLLNRLVERFLFELVGRHDGPPDDFVEVVEDRFEEGFGQVDVSSFFEDFPVDELGDLGHGVIRWTVEFEGLADRGVVVADFLESFTDIDGLEKRSDCDMQG